MQPPRNADTCGRTCPNCHRRRWLNTERFSPSRVWSPTGLSRCQLPTVNLFWESAKEETRGGWHWRHPSLLRFMPYELQRGCRASLTSIARRLTTNGQHAAGRGAPNLTAPVRRQRLRRFFRAVDRWPETVFPQRRRRHSLRSNNSTTQSMKTRTFTLKYRLGA